jgi:gluconokinase
MQYHIGIDIGTSAVKVVAFDAKGAVITRASKGYPLLQPQPGYSEQDPDEICAAVMSGLQEVLQQLSPAVPQCISFSAAMHSLIVLDQDGLPLTACITWADQRASKIADELRHTETGRSFYERTGVPVHAMSPLCKSLWLRKHMPELFNRAARFTGIKEYVLSKLSGVFLIDSSVAAATGFMNGHTLQWDDEILRYAGIGAAQLSEIVSASQAVSTRAVPAIPLLPAGTPLYIGASDGACATIGSGVLEPDIMSVTVGTSGAARMLVKGFQPDAEMRTFCYHVKGDDYIAGGATNNGAIVLDWLRDQLLHRENDFDALMKEAFSLPPGADGLLFLPYLLGERAPYWNADARAVYFGLTMRHGSAYMVRAAMEGVCQAVYSTGRILMQRYPVRKIHASGGFSNNSDWVQMMSDHFNLPVITGVSPDASARGAVLLAVPDAIPGEALRNGKRFEPSATFHRIYHANTEKAARLYTLLKADMSQTDNG